MSSATTTAPPAAPPSPPAVVLIVDAEQRIRHLEGSAFAHHGVAPEAWRGRALSEVLPEPTHGALLPRFEQALGGAAQSFHYEARDGSRLYWVQMAPLRGTGDALDGVVVVSQDVTDHRRVAAHLARSEARLREAERMVGVGSWEMALATREITCSPGLRRLLGLREGETLDAARHLRLVHPADRGIVTEAGRRCRRAGSATCEYRIIRPDGTIRALSLRAELGGGAGAEAEYVRGAVLDITDSRAAEQERLAVEHLFRQGFDASPVGMILSDPLENRCVRVNDALCRMVGRSREELIGATMEVVVHHADVAAVRSAKADMLSGRAASYQSEMRFARSDGTAGWVLLHLTPVRRADGEVEAFHSQLVDISERKEREERLQHDVGDALWLGRLRKALDEERLVLFAQPIVDLITGETVQHELLLRMVAEDGSIIAPGDFLPVAERYGLIAEIDRWVMGQAVRCAAAGMPTEFNLSGRSIGDPAITRELASALAECGADPSLLVVEITETALVGQTEAGREFAERVQALGCRLALDDFGTGFSSLSYLKRFPADHLKIDIEFVRELTTSETDARVVRGIVGLAREFGQTTIAEGVEDEATLLMLKEMGVDQVQGFLFGKPAPHPGLPCAAGAVRCAPATEGGDPVSVVRAAFEAFAARDLSGMLSRCRPDMVLRSFATARLADRREPYRGHDGVREYLRDVAAVWDELTLTPLMVRRAPDSVIGFGRAEGRRPGSRMLASLLWIVHLQDDQIASIEVFQAAGEDSLSDAQLERLAA